MKLEIVLCTYNPNLEFFREQILSLKNQTSKVWKCWVCDDASSDPESIRGELGADSRFEFVRNAHRVGPLANFERALWHLSADCIYVSFCDQDDVWHREKLAVSLIEIERHGAMLVHGDLRSIDSFGRELSPSVWQSESRRVFDLSADRLVFRNSVTGCSMMVRRELIQKALPFPRIEGLYHDHWLALVASPSIVPLAQVLVDYRQHASNVVGVSATVWGWKGFAKHIENARKAFLFRWELLKALERTKTLGSQNPMTSLVERESQAKDRLRSRRVLSLAFSAFSWKNPNLAELKTLLLCCAGWLAVAFFDRQIPPPKP